MRSIPITKISYKNKITFSLGILIAFFGLSFVSLAGLHKVSAADYGSNPIISGGTGSASQFISQIRNGADSKNGHHDLVAIYSSYGLEPASYDQFVSSELPGTLNKDGTLVVNGHVVGNASTTIGRDASAQGAGYFSKNIPGAGTFYGNAAGATFAAGTTSIPAMVLFNAQGQVQFAVLTACGNPIGTNTVTPTYSCNELNRTTVPDKVSTFNFSTSASAGNGATINHVVYDFGDGSATVSQTNPSTSVQHAYTKGGSFTAKVTVYVNLPGAPQKVVTSGGCQTVITVSLPIYQCLNMSASMLSPNDKYTYQMNIAVKAANGPRYTDVVYDFGDGTNSGHQSNSLVHHTYAKPGNYVIKATAYFTLTGQTVTATSPACQAKVAVAQPIYSCDGLTATVDTSNKYVYHFTAASTAKDGATVAKYVYNYGDGQSSTVTSSSTTSTSSHSYTKAGAVTAIVTVYVNRHGDSQTSVSSPKCQAKFTVVNPYYSCVQLAGAILDQTTYSYSFVATANYGNGAQLVSADFTFGDGKSANGVKPTGNTVTTNHAYAVASNYDASATLHFNVNGQDVTAPTCKALVTPTAPPTPECKPGVVEGSPLCTPCQYDVTLPSNSPQCVATPPAELPNTGAGNTIAIAGVVAVAGFMIYRHRLFQKNKLAFAAAEHGTSLLPLGQPLDADAPLAGTPLAPKKHKSFRRKRTF